jgi:hypothetical protein
MNRTDQTNRAQPAIHKRAWYLRSASLERVRRRLEKAYKSKADRLCHWPTCGTTCRPGAYPHRRRRLILSRCYWPSIFLQGRQAIHTPNEFSDQRAFDERICAQATSVDVPRHIQPVGDPRITTAVVLYLNLYVKICTIELPPFEKSAQHIDLKLLFGGHLMASSF